MKKLFFAVALVCMHAPAFTTTELLIKNYPLTVNGKATDLFKIEQPDGTWGYQGVEGDYFDAVVKNKTKQPTVVHWHGLIVPNSQDGVPYVTQPPIPPGGEYHYRFKLKQAGTYWMHSHFDLQVQRFLSAPFIITARHDPYPQAKNVVMFLGDFSFKKPEDILQSLKHSGMAMDKMQGMGKMPGMQGMEKMADSKAATADLIDVNYDAFLTNYRTLSNPDIVHVKPQEQVRLRIIAGSAMSNFFINTGTLPAELIAVDGQRVKPINAKQFQIAVGQRVDLLVKIPAGEGAYPIVAQGEGTAMQTGLVLATAKASIPKLSAKAEHTAGALNYDQEFKLQALAPLTAKKPGQTLEVSLEGDMVNYVWKINNQVWPQVKPLEVEPNKRIEMVFHNNTGMSHPMHLHGHVFEVTEINGKKFTDGAMRDTVLVLPHATVKVQFDSDNPGNWMMHCHMLYHQASGMMTLVNYQGTPLPDLKKMPAML